MHTPTRFHRPVLFRYGAALLALAAALFVGSQSAQSRAADAGYALAFDGVNDVVVLHPTVDMLGAGWENSKTVSLWVKPTAAPAPCPYADPATCDAIFGDRARWWGISIGTLNGQDRIWLWSADLAGPGGPFDMVGVPYTIGQWTHISLVHGNGILQAYRNGILYASTPSGPTEQPPANPVLHLGGIINHLNLNWTFQGELDEVSLWNYPRTQSEIQATMYQSLTGAEAGLKAYYTMSDGSGTSLTDDSQADWTGTLHDGFPNFATPVPPNGAPPLWVPSGAFEPPEIRTIYVPQINL